MEGIFTNNEPVYSLSNDYMDEVDVGEWTAEEFYEMTDDVFQESNGIEKLLGDFFTKHYDSWLVQFIIKLDEKRTAKSEELSKLDTPYMTGLAKEILKEAEARFGNYRLKLNIISCTTTVLSIINKCVHNHMAKKVFGRFPKDMADFCVFISTLPETLSVNDVRKLKIELKKIKKDTKWLKGESYGDDCITPKEKKLCDMMDSQVSDLLKFKMISNTPSKNRQHRIDDRIEQFIETSKEFLESIHATIDDIEKKETIKEYMI